MKNYIKIFIISVLLTSCGDFEPVVYDGDQTLAFFDNSTSTLEVLVDDMGSVDIQIGVSTLSSSARTVNISVVEESTTTDASNYSVPTTVTIPANEYFGTLTVTGIDTTLEISTETITIQVDSVDGGVGSPAAHSISIYQICPIPDGYLLGDYQMMDVVATVGPGNGTSNFGTGVVTITENSPTSRALTVTVLPAFTGGTGFDMIIDLVCNNMSFRDIGSGLGCGGGGGAEYIYTSEGSIGTTYDIGSDDTFTVNYVEDPFGSCGGPYDASFSLTRI